MPCWRLRGKLFEGAADHVADVTLTVPTGKPQKAEVTKGNWTPVDESPDPQAASSSLSRSARGGDPGLLIAAMMMVRRHRCWAPAVLGIG
ncbi:hypothetical protein [Streptomyces luteireticuli]|uniref:hypothetical protein n=1 Tax=Streptomyces luteireticuli TaxID=173858 RepID=UPI003555FB48